MNYPTLEQVQKADRFQICEWYRFLPSANDEQYHIQTLIYEKFQEFGGFTPSISKAIGWTK